MFLKEKELNWIVNGTAFLGSGGGGAKTTGTAFAQLIMQLTDGKRVELATSEHFGAISAIESDQYDAIFKAIDQAAQWLKANEHDPVSLIFPIETGPENTLAPMVAAAKYGIPVFYGDGGGRAVPALQLSAFANSSNPFCPAFVTNDKGDFMHVNTGTPEMLDELLRPVTGTPQFGNSVSLSLCLWPAKELADECVRHTVTRSLAMGAFLEGITTKNQTLVDQYKADLNQLSARLVTHGVVTEFVDKETGAFDFDTIGIQDRKTEQQYTVLAQNENLIMYSAEADGTISNAPDSINYITPQGISKTNSALSKGEEILVIEIESDARLRTERIYKGFQTLVNGLGYYGKLHTTHGHEYSGLGDLLSELIQP